MNKLFHLIVLLLVCCNMNVMAFSVRNLSVENGLSNRRVYNSAIDYHGYIWFATKTGVDRYDGESFDSFRLPDGEKIRGVMVNREQRLVAFTDKSIYAYNESREKFELFFSLLNTDGFNLNSVILTLYFDAGKRVLIGTNQGLYVLNEAQHSIYPVIPGTSVHVIVGGIQDNTYWAGTATGVVEMARQSEDKIAVVENKHLDVLRDIRVQSLYVDPETNKLWIGTFAAGLYIHDVKSDGKPVCINNIFLPVKTITDATEKEIWVGTDGEGIYVFNRYQYTLEKKIMQGDDKVENLGANGIYHILKDNSKLWISSYTAGVFVINTRSIVSRQFVHEKHNVNTLIDNHVNVILEDSDGDLWFGTNKGLSLYITTSGKWKHFLVDSQNESPVVLALHEDENNEIWVGGYATKLVTINKKTYRITEVKSPDQAMPGSVSYVYSIIQDKAGSIWFGGSFDQLKRYHPERNKFTTYQLNGINQILDYNYNTLYFATNKGLHSINKETGKINRVNFNKLKGGEDWINAPFLNNVVADKYDENTLWISTEGYGFYKCNIAQGTISAVNSRSGLSSDYVYGLLYDNLGRLWVSTENGLNCYDQKTGAILSFFEFDGLNNNTFNFLSYYKKRDGNLIFGTTEGAVEIAPERTIKRQEAALNLRFKNFYLFYEKVNVDSPDSPLKTSIDEADEIELSHRQHSFSFDFINLNIENQSRTLYSWRLEGFDDEWRHLSREHKAVYTNIPPGRYNFQVKAVDVNSNKESELRTLSIRIKPSFWASFYAYVLYIFIGLCLAYFFVRFWLSRIDSRMTKEKIRLFTSMAHEIRTPITLIKAPLNEIDAENLTAEGRQALELARRNTDKLLGMASQLLDFQKIEADAMMLCIEETELLPFFERIYESFGYLAKSKGVSFHANMNIPLGVTGWIDRNKVQIIIENLVGNALKYTQQDGSVCLTIDLHDNQLSISVADNGMGIPSKDKLKLFEGFFRARNAAASDAVGTGIGLMLTKKLVMIHKGKISFESEENMGSEFWVNLSCDKKMYREDEIVNSEIKKITESHETTDNINRMQILLVEDNDDLRVYLALQLRKKFDVIEARDGLEAMEILSKESPDLILSDILMPKSDGFELCEKVKADIATCHIPLILLTSLTERENVIKGLNLGADDYISKPFDMSILESKINTIFSNRALFRRKYIEKSITLNENEALSELNNSFLKKLVELIDSNIANEDFNIEDMAYHMAMSRSVFFKKVKSLTGQNPKDFTRDIKMSRAADLLRDKKYSIAEIAYLTGFPNAKYFSTAFKKYHGVSPTNFIEREKREDNFAGNLGEQEHDN